MRGTQIFSRARLASLALPPWPASVGPIGGVFRPVRAVAAEAVPDMVGWKRRTFVSDVELFFVVARCWFSGSGERRYARTHFSAMGHVAVRFRPVGAVTGGALFHMCRDIGFQGI